MESTRQFRTLRLRLSPAIEQALEGEREAQGGSLPALIQRRVAGQLSDLPPNPAPLLWRRPERGAPSRTFAFRRDLVERLQQVATQSGHHISDVAFNLLVRSLDGDSTLAA